MTSPEERHHAAHKVSTHLMRSSWFRRARNIAFYLAVDGELDTWPAIRLAYASGKKIYLPAITRNGSLSFYQWTPLSLMRRNRFGIMEPTVSPRRHLNARQLDLVLTPLVGFDLQGNRLGMGGGYYDRTFAYQRLMHQWKHPPLVGIAYEFQQLNTLQRETWDVPLAGIITPVGLKKFSGRQIRH